MQIFGAFFYTFGGSQNVSIGHKYLLYGAFQLGDGNTHGGV